MSREDRRELDLQDSLQMDKPRGPADEPDTIQERTRAVSDGFAERGTEVFVDLRKQLVILVIRRHADRIPRVTLDIDGPLEDAPSLSNSDAVWQVVTQVYSGLFHG